MSSTSRPVTLSEDAFAKLRSVSTATLTSELLKRGFRNTFLQGLHPLRPDLRMAGYAVTLRYVPAREDLVDSLYDNTTNMQRVAVETVGPDDVLVMDARGDVRAATLGHILATRLQARGCAGVVTDGALRDTPGYGDLEMPSYLRAAHAATSFLVHHPIDVNVPVGCAGVLVMPGDIIVGDAEGVVAIPSSVAEEIAHDTYEHEILEEFLQSKVASGASILGVYPPNDETLAEYKAWREQRDG